ncbi:MAG: thioredoxin family protein [candidate division KSB1 bacterium]|nr:thioredoxin family protein [candidate division KSB1 bacterium]MDZ7345780.1 thioredoxin family protein [candidate division KSB1 bacterium]
MLIALGIILTVLVLFVVLQIVMVRKMQSKRGKDVPQLGGRLDALMRRGKVLFYFYSPSCRACRPMTPIVRSLAQHDKRILLEDVSRDVRTAQQFGVMATPTLVLVQEGKIADILVGYQDESRLRALLAD